MSTLNAAFHNADLIFSLYVALILLYGVLARPGRRTGAMAIAVINHGGLIGLAAILAMPYISPFPVEMVKISTGILIEIFCAFVFFVSSLEIIKFLRTNAKVISDRYLLLLIFCKLLFFAANYIASGGQYGIFSDDSRIDFLTISPILARTFYLDMLLDFIILLNLALRYNVHKQFRNKDLLFFISLTCMTFLTGSKGATFLLLFYIILYIYTAFPRITALVPRKIIALVALIFLVTIIAYIYILSEFLDVTFIDQINLTLSRFLLSADARIMVFDPDINKFVLSQPHGAFISELFRGPARLIGLPTAEFPIGVYQYQYQVGATNYVGSTNQLSAMFILYGGNFWLFEFLVLSSIMWVTFNFLKYSIRSCKPAVSWVAAASFFWLSDTFSMGFDAFVQFLPICLLLIVILTIMPRLRWMPRGVALDARSSEGGVGTGAS
jgi:hypothetical protein